MDSLRLDPERYKELRAYCIRNGRNPQLIKAAREATDSVMAEWLILHVTSSEWRWKRLYLNGVPCCADAFRIYRARLYWNLDKVLRAESNME